MGEATVNFSGGTRGAAQDRAERAARGEAPAERGMGQRERLIDRATERGDDLEVQAGRIERCVGGDVQDERFEQGRSRLTRRVIGRRSADPREQVGERGQQLGAVEAGFAPLVSRLEVLRRVAEQCGDSVVADRRALNVEPIEIDHEERPDPLEQPQEPERRADSRHLVEQIGD